ncbi:MAG: hypothetical protein HC830_02315 [Bacteroidetes bacterium]|nr:hypothetical protein [Bacteroidota bacterium]
MLGRNAEFKGDLIEAAKFYDRLIEVNPKFYIAYILRAKLYAASEVEMARSTLKDCLKIHSKYKPAIIALADTYRESDPVIARKYDNLAKSIK